MAEEVKTTEQVAEKAPRAPRAPRGDFKGNKGPRKDGKKFSPREREEKQYDERVVSINRISKNEKKR